MSILKIPEPNWLDVLGDVSEAHWIADRDRKFGSALKLAKVIQDTYDFLLTKNAVFQATEAVLLDCPFAARWYVSLAGYSQKTLQNISERPSSFGLARRPNTVVNRLCTREPGDKFSDDVYIDIQRFCLWVNDEIDHKHPASIRENRQALIVVAEILGGRIIGQGQNEGGNDAVLLVKELITKDLISYFPLELCINGEWEKFTGAHSVIEAAQLRFGEALVFDFRTGGNRPDIIISINSRVLAVGEIKGRKDLSNVWESWMPQVATHMNAWTLEFPNAARLFFGTLIVNEMVEGFSKKGTLQIGFRAMHLRQTLTSVYNVGNIIAGHAGAVSAFNALTNELVQELNALLGG